LTHVAGAETTREERTWRQAPDLWEDQNPEGEKLRSVAGAKQTRTVSTVAREGRPAEGVENVRSGLWRELADPSRRTDSLHALESSERLRRVAASGCGGFSRR
jgi:hypothetical protein